MKAFFAIFFCTFFQFLCAQQKDSQLEIKNLGSVVNSSFTEFAPLISADGSTMIFSSRRPIASTTTNAAGKKGVPVTSEGNSAIYITYYYEKNKTWTEPQMLESVVNLAGVDNSAIALSNDGQKMLLYRSGNNKNINKGVFETTLKGNEWSVPKRLPAQINSDGNETSASFSPDGKAIYFVSSRAGGLGGRDIWYCLQNESGDWGETVNVGESVNSKEDEESVFLHPNGSSLFFSSKGHNSTGGYDIFVSHKDTVSNLWAKPINLGSSINTPGDDLYFVMAANEKTGYYSSAKIKGMDKDIYRIKFTESILKKHVTLVKGFVIGENGVGVESKIVVKSKATGDIVNTLKSNKVTGKFLVSLPIDEEYQINFTDDNNGTYTEFIEVPEDKNYNEVELNIVLEPRYANIFSRVLGEDGNPISKVQIELIDIVTKQLVARFETNSAGGARFSIPFETKFNIVFNRSGYLFQSVNVTIPKSNGSESKDLKDITLQKVEVEKKLTVNNVFFDFNQEIPQQQSFADLDRVIKLMNDMSSLQIEISGHTDNVGFQDNKKLSEQKAKAVMNYLIGKGCEKGRLKFKGYGSNDPIATNETEEGRQTNNRIEIKVLKVDLEAELIAEEKRIASGAGNVKLEEIVSPYEMNNSEPVSENKDSIIAANKKDENFDSKGEELSQENNDSTLANSKKEESTNETPVVVEKEKVEEETETVVADVKKEGNSEETPVVVEKEKVQETTETVVADVKKEENSEETPVVVEKGKVEEKTETVVADVKKEENSEETPVVVEKEKVQESTETVVADVKKDAVIEETPVVVEKEKVQETTETVVADVKKEEIIEETPVVVEKEKVEENTETVVADIKKDEIIEETPVVVEKEKVQENTETVVADVKKDEIIEETPVVVEKEKVQENTETVVADVKKDDIIEETPVVVEKEKVQENTETVVAVTNEENDTSKAALLKKNQELAQKVDALERKFKERLDSVVNVSWGDPNLATEGQENNTGSENKAVSMEQTDSLNMEIKNIGSLVNTSFSDYAPLIHADGNVMIFSSRRPLAEITPPVAAPKKGKAPKPVVPKAGNENVYAAYYDLKDKKWLSPRKLGPTINLPDINNSAIALSNDGQKMLLHRYDGNQVENGDLFESTLNGEEWSIPLRLPSSINSNDNETSASISPDGKTIYFVSNRKLGLGEKDIWYSTQKKNGIWGQAVNIGEFINTDKDEESVFIHPNGNTLFFSSKGHNSIGGYDIFMSVLDSASGEWGDPKNLGKAINTPEDDLYFTLAANGKTAYYSSSKPKGFGENDIYSVVLGGDIIKKNTTLVKGFITDENGEGIKSKIEIVDKSNDETFGNFNSNRITGKFLVSLPTGKKYDIKITAEGYTAYTLSLDISYKTNYNEIVKNIILETKNAFITSRMFNETGKPVSVLAEAVDNTSLQLIDRSESDNEGYTRIAVPSGKKIDVFFSRPGYLFQSMDVTIPKSSSFETKDLKNITMQKVDVGKKTILHTISFDFNQTIPKQESFLDLDRIITLMNDVPSLQIEIAGHTDNVGSKKDNVKLSNERAKAIVDRLITKGVDKKRLKYKGYGSSEPYTRNDNEAGRTTNNRIELKVLKLDLIAEQLAEENRVKNMPVYSGISLKPDEIIVSTDEKQVQETKEATLAVTDKTENISSEEGEILENKETVVADVKKDENTEDTPVVVEKEKIQENKETVVADVKKDENVEETPVVVEKEKVQETETVVADVKKEEDTPVVVEKEKVQETETVVADVKKDDLEQKKYKARLDSIVNASWGDDTNVAVEDEKALENKETVVVDVKKDENIDDTPVVVEKEKNQTNTETVVADVKRNDWEQKYKALLDSIVNASGGTVVETNLAVEEQKVRENKETVVADVKKDENIEDTPAVVEKEKVQETETVVADVKKDDLEQKKYKARLDSIVNASWGDDTNVAVEDEKALENKETVVAEKEKTQENKETVVADVKKDENSDPDNNENQETVIADNNEDSINSANTPRHLLENYVIDKNEESTNTNKEENIQENKSSETVIVADQNEKTTETADVLTNQEEKEAVVAVKQNENPNAVNEETVELKKSTVVSTLPERYKEFDKDVNGTITYDEIIKMIDSFFDDAPNVKQEDITSIIDYFFSD